MPFTYFDDLSRTPPAVIDRGSGIYLFDSTGRGYIDAIGSWWVSIFGHNHPDITRAVKEQLDKIEHVMMAGFISEPALQLTHLLADMLPQGLSRIFFSDDGSTTVEVALKMALQYHALCGSDRREFVALDGGYHGDTLGAMSVGCIPQYHALFHERFKKQHFAHSPYCYRCPAAKEQSTCNAECMDSLDLIFREHGERIAAFIFEPMVQGASGMRVYPSKVLKRIFSLCKQYGIITIADEVAMGFGRTGKLFACNHAHETPDIMCLAKGLTGGYLPMGVTAVRETIFEPFKGSFPDDRIFNHGHSFTGNPLAASAGCAAMKLIRESKIPDSLEPLTGFFKSHLERFREYPLVGDIRHIGMVGAIEFVANTATKEKLPASIRFGHTVAKSALRSGLLVRPLGDVLYFMPPYTMTEDQMDNMFFIAHRAIREAIDECCPDL
jgi:adenosylmethionine---8-amino-7-oxononanoate aminotransferase